MSGFKRFVSLLSSSLIALGGVSASRSVDMLKRKDAGKIGVPLPNISRENNGAGEKEKKNKKIVGNGEKDGVGGAGRKKKKKKNKKIVGNGKKDGVGGAGQNSASVVKSIDEILSRMPDGEAKFNLKRDIAEYKEKGGENLIRWENIWRSAFISGSYAGNSKQVIRARGAVEAFCNDAEALDLVSKFVSDPSNLANKAKIDDLIGRLSMKSWGKYLLSWITYHLVFCLGYGITGYGLCLRFGYELLKYLVQYEDLEMSDDDIKKYLSNDDETRKKWDKLVSDTQGHVWGNFDRSVNEVFYVLGKLWKTVLGGVVVTQLLGLLSYPLNYYSQKDYGKKEALEKILKLFKK